MSASIRHGLRYTYTYYKCRCTECTTANARYQRRVTWETRRGNIPDDLHGTPSGYRNWMCRCDQCKAAYAEYQRALRQKRRAS